MYQTGAQLAHLDVDDDCALVVRCRVWEDRAARWQIQTLGASPETARGYLATMELYARVSAALRDYVA